MSALKNVWFWIHGLIGAVIGGVATTVAVMINDPVTYNLTDGLPKLKSVAIASALVSAALYLKQSPMPKE